MTRNLQIYDQQGNVLLRAFGGQFQYDETTVEEIGVAIALAVDEGDPPFILTVAVT
jgi:hypothetical protein